ncbi:efflux RND transporter periplasmic adaptor subunit [Rhodopila sp.]|uniref:efflux RND transporter periplasmic adaptor subunit n=1 Tax=Rhodopila sp. TaxID=2480087 RepID=UPI003D0BA2DA
MTLKAGLERRSLWRGLASAGLLACLSVPGVAQPRLQSPAVPVTVTKAVREDVPIWLHGLGTVQAHYAVQLRPRVDGTLTRVPVKEGQEVKQGDLLAVIDPRPYQAALDSAVAKKQQDQAQLSNAQADLARYASLVRQDFASHQQYDTQQAMVKQFSAALLGDDAQIETAQLNLSFCYMTSPFDGRIGLRNVDPGNIVHSAEATPIISVTQIRPINVTFTLPQDNLPQIMQAMAKHPLDVVVYASDNATELGRGILLTPDNTIDTTTGTIKLKAKFPNDRQTLWPGQFVNARLRLGTQTNVMTVAATAVQHGPAGLFVYQVGQNDVVTVEPIQVGRQEADLYVVSAGLAEGAVVVASGQSRLQAGAHVTVREAQAAPARAAPAKSGS